MTKTGFTVWPWRLALLGLALSIPIACGKSSSPWVVEAGAGGVAGRSVTAPDASHLDAPVATGGTSQPDAAVGGSIAIDAASTTAGAGGGGGSGTGGSATAGTGGGSTGPARLDGGLGGTGGTAGITGNAGAIGGRAGSTGGAAGNTGGRSALAGASGQPDAGITGGKSSVDARSTVMDAAWFANDAGIKNCPESLVSGKSLKCEVGSPSICVVAGTYDTYHCSENGWWAKNPDKCPGLLTTGDTCTGEFICLYPSYWFCQCPGMGFPATCGDIRTTSTLLVPRDAGPDVDPHPAILPCPENPQGVACEVNNYPRFACVQRDSTNLCFCTKGAWSCAEGTCPAAFDSRTTCSASEVASELRCLKDDDKICSCMRLSSGDYVFGCG